MMPLLRAVAVVIGATLALGVLAGVLVVMALMPWTANHFGYALPGPRGLPFRLSYAGRHYANGQTCAGGNWCRGNGPPSCATAGDLRTGRRWPLQRVGSVATLFGGTGRPVARPPEVLQRVGSVATLFGPTHPLLRAPTPRGMTAMGLFVLVSRDCYVAYTLEGGP